MLRPKQKTIEGLKRLCERTSNLINAYAEDPLLNEMLPHGIDRDLYEAQRILEEVARDINDYECYDLG